MNDSSEEKTLPASDKKLRKAREKGQIPHSKEMVTAAVTVVCFGYLMLRAPGLAAYLEDGLLSLPDAYDAPFLQAVGAVGGRLGLDALAAVAPLVGLIVVAAVATNIVVNGGLVVSFDPIAPKPEKLNPVEGFKGLFKIKSLLELLKSILKVVVAGILVFQLIEGALQALVEIPACGLSCALPVLGALLKRLLMTMSGLFLVLGALDIGLQRWLFMRDQRMTRTEHKQERKDSDGSPEIKNHHRKERQADGPKTGLRNATFAIRSANVVLAMRYAQGDAPVPVLVARGLGDGMLPLLNELRSLGVPVVFDAETVASVAPRLKVGGLIARDMFQSVIACMNEAAVL